MCTHPPVRAPDYLGDPAGSLYARRTLRRSAVPMQAFRVAFAYARSEARVTSSSDPRPGGAARRLMVPPAGRRGALR